MALKIPYLGALVLFLLAAAPAAHGQSYRWTDKEGNTFYGSNPPAGARNVEKIRGGSFSTYSSSKALAPYQNRLSRPSLATEPIIRGEPDLTPPLAEPALEQGKLQVELGPDNSVTATSVEVKNTGAAAAAHVTISFEFADGTIVQAQGPDTLAGGQSATYSIPPPQLPISITLEEGAAKVPDPSVIIQFSGES